MVEYDQIARSYAQIKDADAIDEYAVYASLYRTIGDVTGKTVLDLATGEGRVSREMAARGAAYVLGIDISVEMLKIAHSRCPPHAPLYYQLGRVGNLGKVGRCAKFDLVVASWLLHYSASRNELFRMCRDIANHLGHNGTFIAVNPNPWNPVGDYTKYGFTVTADNEKPTEGDPLTVTIFDNKVSATFRNYFWRWETYREAMSAAGLDLQCLQIKPTKEGVRIMPPGFWKEYLQRPASVIFKARHI